METCLKGFLKHRLSLTFTTILTCSLREYSIARRIYEFEHSDFKSTIPIREVWLISVRTCSASFARLGVLTRQEEHK